MTAIRFLSLALVFLLLAAAAPAEARAGRVALLIGNSSYVNVPRLANPSSDVTLLAAALSKAGFDVDTQMDLGRAEMVRTLRSFEDRAASADIAVIYFSGHGLEMKGENFLVPVDARLAADRDVDDETVTLSRVLRATNGAKTLKLVILDACRNNPFLTAMSQTRSVSAIARGLAEIEPRSSDTLIAYAAKAGTTAFDGNRSNSPFAASLARHLVEPGLDIRIALGKVRDEVLQRTNNLQEPYAYGSLGGRMVALAQSTMSDAPMTLTRAVPALPPLPAPAETPAPAPTPVPVPVPAPAVSQDNPAALDPSSELCKLAAQHWDAARKLDRIDIYQTHIQVFAKCPFVNAARERLEQLQSGAASGVAAIAPPAEDPVVARPAPSASPASLAEPVEKTVVKPAAKVSAKPVRIMRKSVRRTQTVRHWPQPPRPWAERSAPPVRKLAKVTRPRIIHEADVDAFDAPRGGEVRLIPQPLALATHPEGGGGHDGAGGGGGGGGGGGWH
jgi:uncharacterized protein